MMNPDQKIVPQRVDARNKPHMDGETWQRSTTSNSAAVSRVLDTDDLLIEILLRVGFPTALVRAALVCRRWLHHASDHAFLRRFRELHPPRMLGFYVNPQEPWRTPWFVPMLPQTSELTAVIRRACSIFDSYQIHRSSTNIQDCWNGSVLVENCSLGCGSIVGVHNLLCPKRGLTIVPRVPRFPTVDGGYYSYQQIISKEKEGHDLSYINVLMQPTAERKNVAHVYMLQGSVWCMHNKKIDQIPHVRSEPKSVLVTNKIYMPAAERDIVVLDLTALSFATIQLPQGVDYSSENTLFTRADDADGLYLVHGKKLQLHVWIHKMDGWLLMHTICLRELFASLSLLGCNDSFKIKYVADNAEFVFLETGGCVLYLDVKSKTMRKIYEMTKDDQWSCDIYPLMMIWPPTFPPLKDDPLRNVT